ncbi:MAG TPA: PfkB family carbohydrate kinase [Ktedonobacteraceae bacterium]
MAKTHFDVVVIGSPCVDLVFSGLPHWPVLGQEMYVSDFALSVGAVFNTAATLSRLGLSVGLLCEVGNDLFSRYIVDEVERAGISRELIFVREYPLRSVSVCLPYQGERGFVSYVDPNQGSAGPAGGYFSAEQHTGGEAAAHDFSVDTLTRLENVTWDAAFLYLYPNMRPALELLSQRVGTIFLDAGWSVNTLTDSSFAELARFGHYFMPNQAEAAMITGQQDPREALRVLAQFGPTALIKVGAEGVIARRAGELVSCPALPVERVIDTTGAGDAFDGGFIYGILRGYSFLDALRCGIICGSLSTTALTGTAAVPTAAELERIRVQLASADRF